MSPMVRDGKHPCIHPGRPTADAAGRGAVWFCRVCRRRYVVQSWQTLGNGAYWARRVLPWPQWQDVALVEPVAPAGVQRPGSETR